MTFFVGHTGAIKLQRNGENSFTAFVSPDDVNTTLNRFSFEGSEDNLLTGDQVEISTEDQRGLLFIPASYWGNQGESVDGYSDVLWNSGASSGLAGWEDANFSTISTLPPNGYDEDRLTNFITSSNIRAYVHVNAVGGVRLFPTFTDAINNERENEIILVDFYGEPIQLEVSLADTRNNTLGSVTSFEINTDRAAMDVTSLADKFKPQ